ncbi:MAG: hypothetical protein J5548_01520 [Prevotella sp.]|nr:hypothetical protein [Prevotella sp.]
MSDLRNIDISYKEGRAEKKKKNYLRAARLFKMCHCFYLYGELPEYYWHLESYGLDSESQYEYCKSKLTDEAQQMLEEEERQHFGNWRDFVRFNSEKMDEEEGIPSPNRSREKWWRRWMSWKRRGQQDAANLLLDSKMGRD